MPSASIQRDAGMGTLEYIEWDDVRGNARRDGQSAFKRVTGGYFIDLNNLPIGPLTTDRLNGAGAYFNVCIVKFLTCFSC